MDYTEMLGPQAQPPAQPVAGGYSTAMGEGQVPDELQPKPAASAAEVEQRKAGWLAALDKVQNDPNLARALGMFGASMLQPKSPGQTTAGKFGQSYVVGQTAFDAGKLSETQLEMQKREQARRESESGAKVALEKARLPGVVAESKVAENTVDSKITAAKTAAEAAAFNLSKAKSEEDVAKIEREIKTRKLEAMKLVSDEKVRASVEAEYDDLILKADQARANLGLTKARGAQVSAEAGKDQITLDVLKGMGPDEQKQFLTKTGKYSVHTSGIGQQSTMWGEIYDKLPDTDPNKTGKTREQFQMERLSSAKVADTAKQMSDYVKAMDLAGKEPDPEVLDLFNQAIKSSVGSRAGKPATATPAAAKGGEVWTPVPGTNMEKTETSPGKFKWRAKQAAPSSATPSSVPVVAP